VRLLQDYEHVPLSVELTTTDPDAMFREADALLADFHETYPELVIKVPIGWRELQVISSIRRMGGKVNVTACMSYSQAIMAANAGAEYVSLFWNRIKDGLDVPRRVVSSTRATFA
jgi:transaldolase